MFGGLCLSVSCGYYIHTITHTTPYAHTHTWTVSASLGTDEMQANQCMRTHVCLGTHPHNTHALFQMHLWGQYTEMQADQCMHTHVCRGVHTLVTHFFKCISGDHTRMKFRQANAHRHTSFKMQPLVKPISTCDEWNVNKPGSTQGS